MADSVGGLTFPKTGIQEGHLYFNKDSNTLHIYRGGDPADVANWGEIEITVGGGSSGVGSGTQRWPWKFFGTEVSVNFGQSGEAYFIAPVAGMITKWGIIVGTIALPASNDAIMILIHDPFAADTTIDTYTVVESTSAEIVERVVSFAVNAGDLITVFWSNSINPDRHDLKMSGYVDFTPN
jgi:hypothetical protein